MGSFIGLNTSNIIPEVAEMSKEEQNQVGNIYEEGIEERKMQLSSIGVCELRCHFVIQPPRSRARYVNLREETQKINLEATTVR